MKEIIIEIHAVKRAMERGLKFNLGYPETLSRVFEAARKGRIASRHKSKENTIKCLYFSDNLTFYVVVNERKSCIWIKTVIIEEGRE
ncbi:MAG: hypothetical protein NTV63_01515 [Candidatus Woesearchaeota archaeon]|nr:hypothetical protein [Candidatus Woesearchaeota archaeon]